MAREMKDSGIAWIGEIPREWNRVRLGFLYAFSSGSTLTAQDFVDDGLYAVYGANGQRGFYDSFNCQGKHILIGRVGALCGNIHFVDESIWVTEHALISTKLSANIQDEYGAYLLLSMDLGQYASGTAQPVIAAEKIRRLYVPLPPYSEQRRIAVFLDAECARIDTVIEKTRASIEEYKKLKQSVITEAVTKGIRPGRQMKDSGIEWIGEIPEEWQLSKSKYCVTISNGTDPQTDGDVPVYGSGAVSFKTCGEYKDGPCVLIGRKGATLHIPHYIDHRYWNVDTAFDVKPLSGFNLKYYYYLAVCFDYKYYISQTTLPGMTQSNYENIVIPVPDCEEQNEIAAWLDKRVSKSNDMMLKKEMLLSELESYKKSLIFEYVTGKKEAR